jgi:exopolysaccharide biosynthesis WecB/TagA/CpsF family protein
MNFITKNLFGIDYAIVDYESASSIIIERAKNHESFGVSALAVHGLVTAIRDARVNKSVGQIHLIVPDGQPVRWALNNFHKTNMKDRVYGPTLTLHVLKKANAHKLGVYLYGSTKYTLDKLERFIRKDYPGCVVCGIHVDRFRDATPEEDIEDIGKINASGAHIVLVGRGCPRQEIWVGDHIGKINAAMLAVGAAFDFHAGTKPQAPAWMQKNGLEWLFRMLSEPKRLGGRYISTNSYFIYLVLRAMLGLFNHKAHV